MISPEEIKRITAKTKVKGGAMVIEKDYAITWLLSGIYGEKSKLRNWLLFKGGTALSKAFFPEKWRLSEDLDFTLNSSPSVRQNVAAETIEAELHAVLKDIATRSGINFAVAEFFSNEWGFIRVKVKYTGPLGQTNFVKIEINLVEKMLGYSPEWHRIKSQYTDLPEFEVCTYALEEILLEKIRAIMQRGYSRDYYDVWRLIKEKNAAEKFEDIHSLRSRLIRKCEINAIQYAPELMFDKERLANVKWKEGLERLVLDEVPDFDKVLADLEKIFDIEESLTILKEKIVDDELRAIARVAGKKPFLALRALELLNRYLDDYQPAVVVNALSWFDTFAKNNKLKEYMLKQEEFLSKVQKLKEDPDRGISEAAMKLLQSLGED